jgi:hypothetical protein
MADGLSSDDYREECNPKWRAGIINRKLLLTHRQHIDPEFLTKLATDCVPVRFARFALAAGKFPQATMPLVRRSLANQELIASSGYSRDDPNGLR